MNRRIKNDNHFYRQSSDIRIKINHGEVNARFLQVKILDKKKPFNLKGKTVIFYATEHGNKADSEIQSIQGSSKIVQTDFNRSVVITSENIGAVPLERKINDKALIDDVTLSASDIGTAAIEHGEHVSSVKLLTVQFSCVMIILGNRLHLKTSAQRQRSRVKKVDYAIQEIQVNGVQVSPDLNRYVNVTLEDLEAVPQKQKTNNKSLNSDITLTVADVETTEINHSHTPREVNVATAEQGTKADSTVQGAKLDGNLLVLDDENVVYIEILEVSGNTAAQGAKAD